VRKNAKLTLYEYRWPISARTDMPVVRSVDTDSNGHFDFGSLPPAHYALVVDDRNWGSSNWFDVEVKSTPTPTESVTVDVSPHFPDCKGGHEFIVKTK
jgi:hypothetical protein